MDTDQSSLTAAAAGAPTAAPAASPFNYSQALFGAEATTPTTYQGGTGDSTPTEMSGDELARQIGAIQLEHDETRAIVTGENRALAHGNLLISTKDPKEMDAALDVRLGRAEHHHLRNNDAGFAAQTAGLAMCHTSQQDDELLKRFCLYLEQNAMDDGQSCVFTIQPRTLDSKDLVCVRPLGASAAGWFAMLAHTADATAAMVYYCRDADFVQTGPELEAAHYRWRRLPHHHFTAAQVRCAAVNGSQLAIVDSVRHVLLCYELATQREVLALRLDDHDNLPVQVAMAPSCVALLFRGGAVIVLWFNGDTGQVVVNCQFGFLDLSLGDAGQHRLRAEPTAIAFDQLMPRVLAIGTANGVSAALDTATIGVLTPLGVWSMTPDANVGKAASPAAATAVVSRAPWADNDGCILVQTAATVAVRSARAIVTSVIGATSRYPAMLELGTEAIMAVQQCGTMLVAHEAATGGVLLGSLVPIKSSANPRQRIFRMRPTLLHKLPNKPASVPPYHSIYFEIEHASILLHTGAIARLQLVRWGAAPPQTPLPSGGVTGDVTGVVAGGAAGAAVDIGDDAVNAAMAAASSDAVVASPVSDAMAVAPGAKHDVQ